MLWCTWYHSYNYDSGCKIIITMIATSYFTVTKLGNGIVTSLHVTTFLPRHPPSCAASFSTLTALAIAT